LIKIINRSGQAAFVMTVVSIVAYRAEVLPFRIAFLVFVSGLLLCSLVVVAGLVTLAMGGFANRPIRGEFSLLMMACAICPGVAIYSVGVEGLTAPMIHDISTNTIEPPEFIFTREEDDFRENSLIYPGAESAAKQLQTYPDITTMYVDMTPRSAYQKSLFVASLLGWNISAQDSLILQFEAQATTPLFGFVDDIVVRVTAMGETSSAVDIRSVSRVGVSDFAANAKRIRLFILRLENELENLKQAQK